MYVAYADLCCRFYDHDGDVCLTYVCIIVLVLAVKVQNISRYFFSILNNLLLIAMYPGARKLNVSLNSPPEIRTSPLFV